MTNLNLEGNDLGPYGAYVIGCYIKEDKGMKILNLNSKKKRNIWFAKFFYWKQEINLKLRESNY